MKSKSKKVLLTVACLYAMLCVAVPNAEAKRTVIKETKTVISDDGKTIIIIETKIVIKD